MLSPRRLTGPTDDVGRFLPTRRSVLLGGLGAAAAAVGASGLAACAGPSEQDRSGGANPSSTDASDTAVRFTTTGATFQPVLEIAPGTDVVWLDDTGAELGRGPSPTIDFGSAARRTVTMQTDFDRVLTINLGFDSENDAGQLSLDASFDKPAEQVVGVAGLPLLTSLRRFLAAGGALTGMLDLTGLSALEHVECFNARLISVDLTGCSSLVRLCVEMNDLTTLDLNPVTGTLGDLRAAAQQRGALAFAPLTAPLARLYHFCVRDQTVTGHPTSDELPACEELWNWNTSQRGALPIPGAARSIAAASNHYTSADLTGQWQYDGGWGSIDLTGNRLTAVNFRGCRSLQTLKLADNALDSAAIDGLLREVASWGTPGFELVLDGSNAAPSAAGLAAAAQLRTRGWEVVLSPQP